MQPNENQAGAAFEPTATSRSELHLDGSGFPHRIRPRRLSLLFSPADLNHDRGLPKQAAVAPEADSSLQPILQSGRLADLRWPVFSYVRSQADAFYRGSGYSLAWVKQGKPSVRAVEMINILQHARPHSRRLRCSRWTDRWAHLNRPHSADEEFRFDVALTVCAMGYASAVRVGRINPKHSRFGQLPTKALRRQPRPERQIGLAIPDNSGVFSVLYKFTGGAAMQGVAAPPFAVFEGWEARLYRFTSLYVSPRVVFPEAPPKRISSWLSWS